MKQTNNNASWNFSKPRICFIRSLLDHQCAHNNRIRQLFRTIMNNQLAGLQFLCVLGRPDHLSKNGSSLILDQFHTSIPMIFVAISGEVSFQCAVVVMDMARAADKKISGAGMFFADSCSANDGTIFIASVNFEARIVVYVTIIQGFLGHVSRMKCAGIYLCVDILAETVKPFAANARVTNELEG